MFSPNFPQITRRGLLTAAAGGLVIACRGQAPAVVTSKNRAVTAGCVLATEQEEGPYFVDQALIRSDITEGHAGVPLRLRIVLLDAAHCTPVQNAAVNIWHCDASGTYSGYTANAGGPPFGPPPGGRFGTSPGPPPPGFGPRPGAAPPPPVHHGPVDNTRFFRGVQLTDADGVVEYTTIYPGWYMGRDIHIHLKVSTKGSPTGGHYAGGHVCHTGQLFFPENISDAIGQLQPYASHRVDRTHQDEDGVFTSQHGSDFILSLVRFDKRNLSAGFSATQILGVDPNAEPAPARRAGPEPPGPPGT